MTCGNCVQHVTRALQGVAGVRSAAVSLEGTAEVESSHKTTVQEMLAAVAAEGYEAAVAA